MLFPPIGCLSLGATLDVLLPRRNVHKVQQIVFLTIEEWGWPEGHFAKRVSRTTVLSSVHYSPWSNVDPMAPGVLDCPEGTMESVDVCPEGTMAPVDNQCPHKVRVGSLIASGLAWPPVVPMDKRGLSP